MASTYTLLHANGEVERVSGLNELQEVPRTTKDRIGKHWLLSKRHYKKNWSDWVMHPACDEVIYVLTGSMSVYLDFGKEQSVISLKTNDVATIPRGVWHTIKIQTPCEVLEISRNLDTKHKKKV